MRKIILALLLVGEASVCACGGTDPQPETEDATATDAATARPLDSSARDSSPADASPPKLDASADASPSKDGGSEGGSVDAGDAAADAGALVNFAPLGVATATSEYSGSYAAANANDGVLTKGWYAATDACVADPGGGAFFVCTGLRLNIAFATARTVGRVKIFGNRDGYDDGYDVFTARLELLDAANAVLYTADVTTSRGAEPNGDVNHVVSPAKAGVRTIRVTVLTGQASGPGLGEVEAYAQ